MSVLGVYKPLNIEVDHGDGVYLYAADGTRYLGFYEYWSNKYGLQSSSISKCNQRSS